MGSRAEPVQKGCRVSHDSVIRVDQTPCIYFRIFCPPPSASVPIIEQSILLLAITVRVSLTMLQGEGMHELVKKRHAICEDIIR
jgi:hypothetical protein